ncbi:MAG: glycosyltransferase family 4 protein [Clostridiales bacterium]|nr:glycosyltransferase family 4 protein [Clostridiales bacterium]
MNRLLGEQNAPSEFHVFDFLGKNGGAQTALSHLEKAIDPEEIRTVKSIPLSAYIRMGKLGRVMPYEKLTSSKADLTVFFNYLAPLGLKGKNIITIYDMVCERYPETMQGRNRRLLRGHLKPCAQKADAIVTISDFSKKEIMELYGIPEEKIFVAHCGVDRDFYCPAKTEEERLSDLKTVKDLKGEGRYILYVGTLEPRKNIVNLVAAFDILKDREGFEDVKLVLAGGLGWQPEVTLKAIENSGNRDQIIMTGYISQDQKRALYRCADLFCFPSIYEGFGMPVTEAMACGTKVVIGDSSSLPEASCGLAPKVEINDEAGFALEFEEILSGKKEMPSEEKLIDAVSRFTWDKAADVYRQAIKYCGADFQ